MKTFLKINLFCPGEARTFQKAEFFYMDELMSRDAFRDGGGRATHDCRDVGGRVAPGAVTGDAKADDCMDAGGRATHDHRDVGGRVTPGAVIGDAKADACMDAGGRATQDAKADDEA